MTPDRLTPSLPFHDDELSQGHFARLAYLHAGVNAARFCRYAGLDRADFRHGTGRFIELMAAISDVPDRDLSMNAICRLSSDALQLRGEMLGMPVVRRTTARFCQQCLREDEENDPQLGDGALRQRWSWLLRPVVCCPVHSEILTELSAPDPVNAFDLSRLLVQNDVDLVNLPSPGHLTPGVLQKYVVERMSGVTGASEWLDGQGITDGVKASEVLGALIEAGPNAAISTFSEVDWARVGNTGHGICGGGRGPRRDP